MTFTKEGFSLHYKHSFQPIARISNILNNMDAHTKANTDIANPESHQAENNGDNIISPRPLTPPNYFEGMESRSNSEEHRWDSRLWQNLHNQDNMQEAQSDG